MLRGYSEQIDPKRTKRVIQCLTRQADEVEGAGYVVKR